MELRTSSTGDSQSGSSPHAVLAGVWMIVLAALLLVCGFCSGLFYVWLPLTGSNPESSLQSNVVCGAAAGLAVLTAAAFAWQGWGVMHGHTPLPAARAFPPVWILAIAFVAAVVLGLGALVFSPASPYLFPPWHFLAASLPPVAFVAYAAHRCGTHSGLRALFAALGWGALAATLLSTLFEVMAGVLLILIAALVLGSLPSGQAILEQMRAQLEQAQRTGDLAVLAKWLSSPWVTGGLFLYFALMVPPVEEAAKTLVLAFCDPRRTGLADALLWGISAGAGFAVTENLLNASATLEAWAPAILLRIGATTMHVATGALMGRGWYAARVERRWGRLGIAYAVSVFFHAAWNGAAVYMSSQVIAVASSSPPDVGAALRAAGALLVLALCVSLGLTWIVVSVRAAQKVGAAA